MLGSLALSGAVGSLILGGIISAAAPKEDESSGLPLARAVFFNAQGTLLIYDAAVPPLPLGEGWGEGSSSGDSSPPARLDQMRPYLAYWHDYGTRQVYFYEQLLINQKQLHAAIVSLEQTFGAGLADLSRFASPSPGASAGEHGARGTRGDGLQKSKNNASSPADQNHPPLPRGDQGGSVEKPDWREATAEAIYALMRMPGEPPAFGPLMVTAAACPPFECEELYSTEMPGADGMSTPTAPEDDAEFDDLLSDALLAINCCGGGGGGGGGGCYGCCCCPVLAATAKLAEFDGTVIAAGGCCTSLACDDGYPCTLSDQCGGWPGYSCGPSQCCGIPKNCDDGNPCTGDVCFSYTGTCVNTYLCNDGNACTIDSCDGTGCTHVANDCDDDDPCTYDYCHFSTGCGHEEFCDYDCCDWAGGPSCCTITERECCEDGCCDGVCCNGACCHDDNDLCTIEQCGIGGVCERVPLVCPPDGNECTDDACFHGECNYTPFPAGTTCNDEPDPCTLDLCDAQAQCTHPPGNDGATCADEPNICTNDVCFNGVCTHPCRTDCILCSSGGQVAGQQNGFCINCACSPESCGIAVTDGIACPGGTADVVVSGACGPPCITTMAWQITSTSPYITGTSGSLSCAGKSLNVQVGVAADAPAGPLPITITGTTPGGAICFNSATINVAGVVSLEWDEYAAESTPLDGCPNNGGKRIFPDHAAPSDEYASIRRKVTLAATISPVVEGCNVHFRTFDVDDPFDQNNAAMPDVGVIDANTSGPDNRPVGAVDSGVVTGVVPVEADGKARFTIDVSMQPGNNYRAAASTSLPRLNAVTQTQADANAPPAEVKFSEMLTVWRKLHVELAAMDRPLFDQNTWTGSWWFPRQTEVADRVVVSASQMPIDENQLEQGLARLTAVNLTALPTLPIFESTNLGGVHDIVLIMRPPGGPVGIAALQGATNGDFVFCDDDIAEQTVFDAGVDAIPGTFGADVNRFGAGLTDRLPYPALAGANTLFQPAYIVLVEQGENPARVPFIQQLPSFLTNGYFDNFAAIRSPSNPISVSSFWTALVGAGFQSNNLEDADPEDRVTKGASPHGNGATSAGSRTGLVVVFLETIDDAGGVGEFRIAAHEIAHTLGVPHDPDGTGGLMEAYPQGAPVFTPANVKVMREYEEP